MPYLKMRKTDNAIKKFVNDIYGNPLLRITDKMIDIIERE